MRPAGTIKGTKRRADAAAGFNGTTGVDAPLATSKPANGPNEPEKGNTGKIAAADAPKPVKQKKLKAAPAANTVETPPVVQDTTITTKPASKKTKAGTKAADTEPAQPDPGAAGDAQVQAGSGKGGKKRGVKRVNVEDEGDVVAVETASGAVRGRNKAGKAGKEPKREEDADKDADDGELKVEAEAEGNAETRRRDAGLSRKAAQRVQSYREGKDDKEESDAEDDGEEAVKVSEPAAASTEEEAVRQTAVAGARSVSANVAAMRSLEDFSLADSEGRAEPLDRLSNVGGGLFITGVVYPPGGRPRVSDAKQHGRRVASVGPVTGWHLRYSATAAPAIVLQTALAQYVCGKPIAQYKKLLEPLFAQVELAGAVHAALCPHAPGGRTDASFDDVCCKVARTKVSRQYGGARYALKLNGRFILEQLAAMSAAAGAPSTAAAGATEKGKGKEKAGADKGKGSASGSYDDGPFARGLKIALETEEHMPISNESMAMLMGGGAPGGIRIASDGGAATAAAAAGQAGSGNANGGSGGGGQDTIDSDYELARRLWAKEYAGHMNGGNRAGGSRGGARTSKEPYLQVREEEIADDYPAPREYKGVEGQEEWDELVLEDSDLLGCGFHGADDRGESHTLDQFAIYNAEGLLTTLELVPMEAGLDAEVNIFASGVVANDSGAWGQPDEQQRQENQEGAEPGGSDGAGGSGAGGKGDGLPRYYSTQIREWFIEFGPGGQVAINIRTDVSWYRLLRPLEEYARRHSVVMRIAHIALQVLTWLDEQDRAARLSFADIVFRLASLSPKDPAYVSAKMEAVERFVVVHGQVILNCINRHYKEAIRRCAFANTLRAKLAERQHRKLSSAGRGAKGFRKKAASAPKLVLENPVKDRQQKKGGRPLAMPATTTAQVRRIWSEYFATGTAPVEDGDQQQQQAVPQEGEGAAAAAPPKQRPEQDRNGVQAGGRSDGAHGCAVTPDATVCIGEVAQPKNEAKTWTLVEERKKDSTTGRAVYGAAVCGGVRLTPGSVIRLGSRGDGDDDDSDGSGNDSDSEGDEAAQRDTEMRDAAEDAAEQQKRLDRLTRGPFGLVQCIFTKKDSKESGPKIQVRRLVHGRDTMLADVASLSELFLLDTTPMPAVPASRGGGPASTRAAPQGGEVLELSLNGTTVAEVLDAQPLSRPCSHATRLENAQADLDRLRGDKERLAAGRPPLFVYRHVYCPQQGKFRECRTKDLALGSYVEASEAPPSLALLPDGTGFIKDGVTYKIGDFLYVRAAALDKEEDASSESESEEDDEEDDDDEEEKDEEDGEGEEEEGGKAAAKRRAVAKRRTHKGSNDGLRAFQVVQLLGVEEGKGGKASGGSTAIVPSGLQIRRFYRPEDISRDVAYRSDFWGLYAPALGSSSSAGGSSAAANGSAVVPVGEVYGKCRVVVNQPRPTNPKIDTFVVVGSYNPQNPGKTGAPPLSLDPPAAQASGSKLQGAATGAAADGRKGSKQAAAKKGAPDTSAAVASTSAAGAREEEEEADPESLTLASLDIFAGCGGLSEGMHQAGVADTKWAIEYESEAAEAFRLNNPDAKVFCNNCNVLLMAAMEKAGQLNDCVWHSLCEEAVAKLDEEYRKDLPAPGEVGLMMGGPPCQGYSGMNRFNKGNWSQIQNSMVMAYLSYCDFYRPRYFLLENVRNFVSYNGGRVFRLVIRTLLDLGFQVRFGIMNAGNFGVAQSRKRTFIWAAQPGEVLPDWPTPRHMFLSAQLGIRMESTAGPASYFVASGSALAAGAPLRTVTVRDAIADLPPVDNFAKEELLPYTGEPASAFQRSIRGSAGSEIRDHIVKPMNELNLERCRCIPVGVPGADWHVLQKIVAEDPSRELYKGQPLVPWCLPNTADRHNGWRGLYGRLDPDGHFPTATTDPNPMGKVGQVLHPDQDRIVSVRECARAQGFPDHFRFSGNIHCRHRQVGNAVPPPLARALGSQLRLALKEQRRRANLEAAEQLKAMRARRQQQQQGKAQ